MLVLLSHDGMSEEILMLLVLKTAMEDVQVQFVFNSVDN